MSDSDDLDPARALALLGESEQRPVLFAIGGLILFLGVAAAMDPGGLLSSLAVVILIAAPLVALALSGRAAIFFLLLASIGSWLVFGRVIDGATPSLPVALVSRLAFFAAPPLIVDLALSSRGRTLLRLGLLQLYAPAAVAAVAVVVYLATLAGEGATTAGVALEWAAGFYGICYGGLLAIALLVRLMPAPQPKAPTLKERAGELEEEGRYALAARAYEQQGQVDRGAQAAERASDWPRAATLYRRAGEAFKAGEMYYRAGMWDDALACYELARAYPAAARLCQQLGQIDRAAALFEKAGDLPAALKVLEGAGRPASGQQYLRAGMPEQAAAAFEASGDWVKAAEICEQDLRDGGRAASLHVKHSSFIEAGRLLEGAGRLQEALEAYCAVPAGALAAARLYLRFGRTQEAAAVLSRLPAKDLEAIEDAETLTLVARVLLETGRNDDAIRMLQGLKRKGESGGSVRLLLGRGFLNRGLNELAEAELRIATNMPLDPAEEVQAAYLLGCVLESTQQFDEARQIFHGILEKDLQYADVEERYRRVTAAASSRPAFIPDA